MLGTIDAFSDYGSGSSRSYSSSFAQQSEEECEEQKEGLQREANWNEVKATCLKYRLLLQDGSSLEGRVERTKYLASEVGIWVARFCSQLAVPQHLCNPPEYSTEHEINPYPLIGKVFQLNTTAKRVYGGVSLDSQGIPETDNYSSQEKDLILERFVLDRFDWLKYFEGVSKKGDTFALSPERAWFIERAFKMYCNRFSVDELQTLKKQTPLIRKDLSAATRKLLVNCAEIVEIALQKYIQSHARVVSNPTCLLRLIAGDRELRRLTIIDYLSMTATQGSDLGKMIGVTPQLEMLDLNSRLEKRGEGYFLKVGLNHIFVLYHGGLDSLQDFRVNCSLMRDLDELSVVLPKMKNLRSLTLSFQPDRRRLKPLEWQPWWKLINIIAKETQITYIDLSEFEGPSNDHEKYAVHLLTVLQNPVLKEARFPSWVESREKTSRYLVEALAQSETIEKLHFEGRWSWASQYASRVCRCIEINFRSHCFLLDKKRLIGRSVYIETEVQYDRIASLEKVHIAPLNRPRFIISDAIYSNQLHKICDAIRQFRGTDFSIVIPDIALLNMKTEKRGTSETHIVVLFAAIREMISRNRALNTLSIEDRSTTRVLPGGIFAAIKSTGSVRKFHYSGTSDCLKQLEGLTKLSHLSLKGDYTTEQLSPFFSIRLKLLEVETSEMVESQAIVALLENGKPHSVKLSLNCKLSLQQIQQFNPPYHLTIMTNRKAFDQLFTLNNGATESDTDLRKQPWVETSKYPDLQEGIRTVIFNTVDVHPS